jgi:hypothetical protein
VSLETQKNKLVPYENGSVGKTHLSGGHSGKAALTKLTAVSRGRLAFRAEVLLQC